MGHEQNYMLFASSNFTFNSYLHDIFGFSVPTVYTFRATLQVTVKWQVIWEIIIVLSLYYAAQKMNWRRHSLKGQYRKMLRADQRVILRIAGWRCWTHWIWVKEYEITLWNIEPVLHVHGEFKRTSEIESEGDAFTGYHPVRLFFSFVLNRFSSSAPPTLCQRARTTITSRSFPPWAQ